jgi:hypothetical protein
LTMTSKGMVIKLSYFTCVFIVTRSFIFHTCIFVVTRSVIFHRHILYDKIFLFVSIFNTYMTLTLEFVLKSLLLNSIHWFYANEPVKWHHAVFRQVYFLFQGFHFS